MAAILFVCGTSADTIYQSALMGPTNRFSGFSVFSNDFLAVKFTLSSETRLTSVGGNIGTFRPASQSLFAAIFPLTAGDSYIYGNPFSEADALGWTTFSVAGRNQDLRVPLQVTLPAGDYSLVFGSGRFGTTGDCYMPGENIVIPNLNPVFSFWVPENRGWNILAIQPPVALRFVIEASPVPEPSGLCLLCCGSLLLLVFRRPSAAFH